MNTPQIMILSTNGSNIRPNLVTWLYFLAQYPSTQSVPAAMVKMIIDARYSFQGINRKTTTASNSRKAVTWCGTLKSLFDVQVLAATVIYKSNGVYRRPRRRGRSPA